MSICVDTVTCSNVPNSFISPMMMTGQVGSHHSMPWRINFMGSMVLVIPSSTYTQPIITLCSRLKKFALSSSHVQPSSGGSKMSIPSMISFLMRVTTPPYIFLAWQFRGWGLWTVVYPSTSRDEFSSVWDSRNPMISWLITSS